MSGKSKTMPVDYEKMKYEMRQRKLTMEKASLEMGYGKSFLAKCYANPNLPVVAIKLLDATYGVKYDDIKPDPKPEPEPAETAKPSGPVLSIPDRLTMDKMSEAVTKLSLMVNAQTQAILAATDALKRIAEKTDKLDALMNDPMAMYKAVFVPVYNAVKTAEIDRDDKPTVSNITNRRIDGTPKYTTVSGGTR